MERGAPLSAPGFSRMIKRAAIAADLGIKAHAHMLRHACGYKLANGGHDTRAIQAYLGHRNIQNTTRYTALAPQRFKEFFRDLIGRGSRITFAQLFVRPTARVAHPPQVWINRRAGPMEPAAKLRLATIAGSIGDIIGASTR